MRVDQLSESLRVDTCHVPAAVKVRFRAMGFVPIAILPVRESSRRHASHSYGYVTDHEAFSHLILEKYAVHFPVLAEFK